MGTKTAEPLAITFDRWCKASGYDPESRSYDDTGELIRAVPRVHPGTHYTHGRKVA